MLIYVGKADFWTNSGLDWMQVGKSGTFKDQFSVYFSSVGQYVLKIDLKKSQISPVGVRLSHIFPNSDDPSMIDISMNNN